MRSGTRKSVQRYRDAELLLEIDCFYCHHEWIGKGVGSALMKEILQRARNNHIHLIFSEISITAKPFFEQWEYKIVTQQTIVRKGVELTNFKIGTNSLTFVFSYQNI